MLPRKKPAKRPARRAKVLALLHPDGYIEVHADVSVDFRAVLVLDTAPENEAAALAYADLLTPRSHRGLPVRATAFLERRTVQQEAERRYRLELVRELVNIGRGRAKVPAAIEKARRARG